MLASWDTLAEGTGMGKGTVNAVTRPRLRTCLAISGLVDSDRALALVEVAPHCNGTGNNNPRPIIGSVCKPKLFVNRLDVAYAPRGRRAPAPVRGTKRNAVIEPMERLMGCVTRRGE